MDKHQAKRMAYEIAANWIQSNQEEGATEASCFSRGITDEKNLARVERGLAEIVASLQMRSSDRGNVHG